MGRTLSREEGLAEANQEKDEEDAEDEEGKAAVEEPTVGGFGGSAAKGVSLDVMAGGGLFSGVDLEFGDGGRRIGEFDGTGGIDGREMRCWGLPTEDADGDGGGGRAGVRRRAELEARRAGGEIARVEAKLRQNAGRGTGERRTHVGRGKRSEERAVRSRGRRGRGRGRGGRSGRGLLVVADHPADDHGGIFVFRVFVAIFGAAGGCGFGEQGKIGADPFGEKVEGIGKLMPKEIHRGWALLGIFGQGSKDEVFKFGGERKIRPDVRERRRISVHMAKHDLVGTAALKRRLPGERFKEDHAERVDIRAVVGGAFARLFGRHVARGADGHPGAGEALVFIARHDLGDTKVEDLDLAFFGGESVLEEDIVGLEVAVIDPTRVSKAHRIADLVQDPAKEAEVDPTGMLFKDIFKTVAFEELHRDVKADAFFKAEVVDVHDIGVAELVLGLGFAVKAPDDTLVGREMSPEDLHSSFLGGVEGLSTIDEAHPTFAELLDQAEASDLLVQEGVGLGEIERRTTVGAAFGVDRFGMAAGRTRAKLQLRWSDGVGAAR